MLNNYNIPYQEIIDDQARLIWYPSTNIHQVITRVRLTTKVNLTELAKIQYQGIFADNEQAALKPGVHDTWASNK